MKKGKKKKNGKKKKKEIRKKEIRRKVTKKKKAKKKKKDKKKKNEKKKNAETESEIVGREANPDLDEESAGDLEEKKVEVKAPQEKGSGKEKATSPEPEEN